MEEGGPPGGTRRWDRPPPPVWRTLLGQRPPAPARWAPRTPPSPGTNPWETGARQRPALGSAPLIWPLESCAGGGITPLTLAGPRTAGTQPRPPPQERGRRPKNIAPSLVRPGPRPGYEPPRPRPREPSMNGGPRPAGTPDANLRGEYLTPTPDPEISRRLCSTSWEPKRLRTFTQATRATPRTTRD